MEVEKIILKKCNLSQNLIQDWLKCENMIHIVGYWPNIIGTSNWWWSWLFETILFQTIVQRPFFRQYLFFFSNVKLLQSPFFKEPIWVKTAMDMTWRKPHFISLNMMKMISKAFQFSNMHLLRKVAKYLSLLNLSRLVFFTTKTFLNVPFLFR